MNRPSSPTSVVIRRRRPLAGPPPAGPASERRGFLRRSIGLLAGALTLGATARRAQAAPQDAYPYVGEIMLWAGAFTPAGWLPCNGQIVPIHQYETLFNLIGTRYGGDGQDTFGIPDLRGSVPIHAGQGPGLTPRIAGEKAGVEDVTLSAGQLPGHAHAAPARSAAGTSPDPGGLLPARNAAGSLPWQAASDAMLAPGAIGAAGGGQPHPNLPPFLTVTFVIAYTGTWPSPS
jgi:microcystin-dependent protein